MNNKNEGPNLNGPEAMPLREYIKSCLIVVSVYDGEKLIRKEEIDYGNAVHRKWLGKVTYWAVSNHYCVETISKEDYDSSQG